MNDVMIDIETLGLTPDSVILSIAAVEFDRETGELRREFYKKIDISLQNRRVCTETLKWWFSQPKEVFAETMSGGERLNQVLFDLFEFMPGLVTVWAQGTDFDIAILNHAYDATRSHKPWRYNATRDTRTLYDVAGFDPKSITREGTHHNALDDCKYQIKCVVAALKGIRA